MLQSDRHVGIVNDTADWHDLRVLSVCLSISEVSDNKVRETCVYPHTLVDVDDQRGVKKVTIF